MSTFEKVRDITVEQLSVDADEVKMESWLSKRNLKLKSLTKKLKKSAPWLMQSKCWMKKNNLLAAQGKALRSFP